MEWNPESVLDALNEFERRAEISPILNEYLKRIAKNGEIVFPWNKLKPLLKKKLDIVLDEFYETCPVETSAPVPNFEAFNFETLKKTILTSVEAFTSAPFTIQRLCELVTDPQKHYNRTDKYMRGIEKNVLVVSTVEPRLGSPEPGNNNNIPIVNGMPNELRDDNDGMNGHDDNVSSSNMNTPSNHVLLENFANVFPSAACIPSSTNMCMDRDEIIDQMKEDMHREIDAELGLVDAELKEKIQAELDRDMDLNKDENSEMGEVNEDEPKVEKIAETSSEGELNVDTVEQDSNVSDSVSETDTFKDSHINSEEKLDESDVNVESSDTQNEQAVCKEESEECEPMDTSDDTEAEAFIMSETCSRVFRSVHSAEITDEVKETDNTDVVSTDVCENSDIAAEIPEPKTSVDEIINESCEQDDAITQSDGSKCVEPENEQITNDKVQEDPVEVKDTVLPEEEVTVQEESKISQSSDDHIEPSEQSVDNGLVTGVEESSATTD